MTGALALLALVLVVAAAHAAAARLRPKRAWMPIAAVALLAGVAAFDLTRYDLGQPEAFRAIAWIVAPVVAIFGGALWGARRFHGWPDLGPAPGRIATVAGAILVGVLAGMPQAEKDLLRSQETAEGLRTDLLAWRTEHVGEWPRDLRPLRQEPPKSSMGWIAPPPVEYGQRSGRTTLSFAVSGHRVRVLDIETGTWTTEGTP